MLRYFPVSYLYLYVSTQDRLRSSFHFVLFASVSGKTHRHINTPFFFVHGINCSFMLRDFVVIVRWVTSLVLVLQHHSSIFICTDSSPLDRVG